MANVYIEVRSKSLPHGSRVEDYVFEDMLIMFCKPFKTQREAIDRAHGQGHHPLVARVRRDGAGQSPCQLRTKAAAEFRQRPSCISGGFRSSD
jgi:hypothetical protein